MIDPVALSHPLDFVSFFGDLHPEATHGAKLLCQVMHTLVRQSLIGDIAFEVKAGVIEDNRVCQSQSKTVFVEQVPGAGELGGAFKIGGEEASLRIEEAFHT